ncbi:succinylglutamate desuccinylase/aspartoacylase family protein [Bradyrhizobium sp.]|uniref:succinylglutamate desuccinylase/aspartoacylase family protein n=1 Tax=Bradyrhizobium sp. TaxID=376 RepID=UPI001EC4A010|nr:succinylglutamate desuccinylase/aspartoacylase family protein [Bradyrhizobium sp.]MBV9982717.1 succinylglutamate desuccinylase/aspartoacylase family protein [Bradyrhizobium sp.]
MHTGLFHTFDLERDGKTLSHLGLPFSVDRSPYFQIKVPICVIRNGEGPSVLLMAGNHGDEYEGELSLARLIRRLDPTRMRGRVTILPLANTPAVLAARRCSPLDGGNLNRAFPGEAQGMPTQRLAHFLETELFPRHDVVFDIHSGGTSMAHLLCALIETNTDPSGHQAALSLMRRLGLPFGFVADNGPAAPTSMGAARRAGAIGLSGEFGGGGATTPESMAATEGAIDNLLLALGVTDAPVFQASQTPASPMRLLALSRQSQAIYAVRRGWFEPAKPLGALVAAGDVAGFLHDLERLDAPEEELRFAEDGVVLSHRLHTMCEAGDCLMQVAEVIA